MSERLRGKVAVVTGAGGMGIGQGCALALAREGAAVVGCDIDQKLAEETLALAKAEGLTYESFVADLVAMAPAVLFSAAIPGQGGVGHRNEQWPSWWAGHFATHGYLAYDVVRPAIWTDEAIPAWYRQNIVLYLDPGRAGSLGLTPTAAALLDRVHPAFWSRANRELGYANALPESEVLRRQAAAAQQ